MTAGGAMEGRLAVLLACVVAGGALVAPFVCQGDDRRIQEYKEFTQFDKLQKQLKGKPTLLKRFDRTVYENILMYFTPPRALGARHSWIPFCVIAEASLRSQGKSFFLRVMVSSRTCRHAQDMLLHDLTMCTLPTELLPKLVISDLGDISTPPNGNRYVAFVRNNVVIDINPDQDTLGSKILWKIAREIDEKIQSLPDITPEEMRKRVDQLGQITVSARKIRVGEKVEIDPVYVRPLIAQEKAQAKKNPRARRRHGVEYHVRPFLEGERILERQGEISLYPMFRAKGVRPGTAEVEVRIIDTYDFLSSWRTVKIEVVP